MDRGLGRDIGGRTACFQYLYLGLWLVCLYDIKHVVVHDRSQKQEFALARDERRLYGYKHDRHPSLDVMKGGACLEF